MAVFGPISNDFEKNKMHFSAKLHCGDDGRGPWAPKARKSIKIQGMHLPRFYDFSQKMFFGLNRLPVSPPEPKLGQNRFLAVPHPLGLAPGPQIEKIKKIRI